MKLAKDSFDEFYMKWPFSVRCIEREKEKKYDMDREVKNVQNNSHPYLLTEQ